MIDPQAIISIRNDARRQKREGHTETIIDITALEQLCELALEHPLVDESPLVEARPMLHLVQNDVGL